MRYFQAVALDLDGTIASAGPPAPEVLAAIRSARAHGVRVLLVTGRVLAELAADMPGVIAEFDAVVAENGAVLAVSGEQALLSEPVDRRLAERLHSEGVAVHRGQVLVACESAGAHLAVDAVRAMQLDVQLVWNRSALMLLPSGVTKGSGVRAGLAALGISPHSAVGVGDAENDHALLQACELGVAVANAVPALAEHADIVLAELDGAGVAGLLGRVARGSEPLRSSRRRLLLGTAVDGGRPVTIPASQSTVLVTGRSGSGKSYLTGLLAEQMISQGYSVLLVDPEGDHAELGTLHHTLLVGDSGRLPQADELVRIIDHECSVVLDLSLHHGCDLAGYLRDVHRLLRAHRERTGLPHWFVIDEAHLPQGLETARHEWGYCLTTYRPDGVDRETIAGMGWHVQLRDEQLGEAVLTPLEPGGGPPVTMRIARRATAHVRHHHKYTDSKVCRERGFHFRTPAGRTGAVATNLRQFVGVLERCDQAVVRHHAAGHDFSRWTWDVLADPVLAERVHAVEHATQHDPEAARSALVDAITARYGIRADRS